MSSTLISSLKLNGIFSDVSIYGKMVGTKECLGIFLYNDTNETINNISLQQIYSNIFGKENNQCVYEYAAVEPSVNSQGSIQIDLISNITDEPYNVEWFKPTSKRENTTVKVLTSGVIGDFIIFLDVEIELTGNTIVTLINDIVLALTDNEDFLVQKKSDTEIYVERKTLIETGDIVEIISPDTASSDSTNLSGYVDGSILLLEEMPSKTAIGIWIKRTITPIKPCASDCTDLSCIQNEQENLELIFSFD